MARRLGIYTLGHFMSLNGPESFFTKKLWNPLLQNFESWELSELSTSPEDLSILEQSIMGMTLTHEQIQRGFFPLTERVQCLERIRAEFLKNFDNLVQILSMEVHKPLSLARAECERCVQTLEATIFWGKKLLDQEPAFEMRVKGSSFQGQSNLEGRKLSLALTPFNFPLNLSLHKIAPAILAGSPLMWRPSSKAQLSGLALIDILHAAKIPAGILAFMPMKHDVFWKLLLDSRIEAVSFTGSAKVGWQLQEKFKGPLLLELGGAAPVYLEKTDTLEKNLQSVLNSAYSFAGQSCISAQSLFIREDAYEEAKKILKEKLSHFAVGKTWDEKTLCSSVIDDEAAQRIETTLKAHASEITRGAHVEIPHYVAPTIVEKASEKLLKEEIFGPVLNLQKTKDFSEFAAFANALPYRLQCAVFSQDPKTLAEAKHLNYGGVCLNLPSSTRIDALPYGGRGLAGLGMECPQNTWEFFSSYKTIFSP